jgi:ADP-heptose:LPS heptosyltransferase/glycosyltransferase involved in cell wall biosynthesis
VKRKLHFSGPVLTASGYGVHARQLLSAIRDAGEFDIAVESLRWGETPFLMDPEFDWIRELSNKTHANPDVSIQVTIPNEFKRKAPLTIGVTAGIEVDRVSPHWILKCNTEVDLVVVPSEHSRVTFMVEYHGANGERLRLEKPIFVVPEGVDTSAYRPDVTLSPLLDELNVPAKNFIFTGLGLDKAQGKDRKNVSRLVEYFCKTFAGNNNVGLILKTSIVNGSAIDFEVLKKRIGEIKQSTGCGEFPKIFVIHGRLSDKQLAEIYNDQRVISAISLTHGEGFGLPLIEAAACALPVMVTDWSGHIDFLTKEGKKLFVPFAFDLEQIHPDTVWEGVMDAGTKWATVKENDVASKMQKMVLSSATPKKWAEELAAYIASRYDLKSTGEFFVNLLRKAIVELAGPEVKQDFKVAARAAVKALGPSLLYTMPMSAGDVFLSTGVVRALRKKHPGHRVYFATTGKYYDIIKDLKLQDGTLLVDEIVEWQPWMQDPAALEEIFDVVYTPNMNVQLVTSNWVHRGKGRNLIDEFAAQCDVYAERPPLPAVETPQHSDKKIVAIHAGGQKSARSYAHWTELVKNLRAAGLSVVQVGAKDDNSIGEIDVDLRGKTDHKQLVEQLLGCDLFIGIDSYPMHVAAVAGLNVIAIFGSSYPNSTGPKINPLTDFDILTDRGRERSKRLKLLETTDRNGCEKACYKDTCKVDASNPCLNNVAPAKIFQEVLHSLDMGAVEYKEFRPKIAGYTHILNPKTHGYPYVQSILSMMDFCDEVIVVDGGSTDGSVEFLHAELEKLLGAGRSKAVNDSCQLRVITREWDPDEPGMDGMQKAFGRAMVSPDVEFLWQQDADEIVHERDYAKIIDICKRFPADVDLVHLPVVELWGDEKHVRTDRHSWKWRLSRNNLRITHGIAIQARQTDPKSGRIYAKQGMSDGCEMIDMVTGEPLQHRGFYTGELEKIRREDPEEYGRAMNAVFDKLPSVWHYSWADLPRKVRNFRDFWDKQWQVLYQTPPEPRFADVVTDDDISKKAEELRARGGEHGKAQTFEIALDPPEVMKGWF